MSLMADKSPAPAPTPQQVTQAWHYNMNMYNMNMYQNPYMYNPAFGAHNYYQYYGRMPNAWANYRGYAPIPGNQMQAWGIPPQPQLPTGLEQQTQIQSAEQAQQQPAEDMMIANSTNNKQVSSATNNNQVSSATNNTQDYQYHDLRNSSFCPSPWLLNEPQSEPSTELPPLPPGPPPGTPAPPGTQTPSPRPFHQFSAPLTGSTPNAGGVGPIRFNVNTQRPRPQLSQANPLGVRPGQTTSSSKRKNKKKKKQLQQQLQQQQLLLQQQRVMEEENDEPETPPLPASPPPPPPPPPPPISAPPLPQQPVSNPVPVPHHPPGIKYIDDWPPSLRDYVNRCYAKCVLQVDMDRVGVILKGKILRATSDGTLWTKNWTDEPLPLLDSDSKPAGGLTLGINLKEKTNKMSSRLGPPQKNQDQPQQRNNQEQHSSHKRASYRPSFKRNYSSDSSSSSTSDSEDNSSCSNSKRSRDKRSSQSWSNKRHSNKKSSEKAHMYKEYGSIGGGVGGPIRKEVLDKRAARFSCDNTNRNKNGLTTSTSSPPLYVIDTKPNSQSGLPSIASVVTSTNGGTVSAGNNTGVHDWEEDLHIVGTSFDIEKPYLRLTSAPDASQVRPPQILAKALSMVKERWAKEADYHYTCEQLKSIRQDLTVQGIRDEFTIEVYETHARIALEKGDHAEFNQCQSQLCQLHTLSSRNRGEFVAYRILYYIFTNEFLDLSTLIHSLSEEDKEDDCISHGLKMAKAWTTGLHSRLFKLYLTAPRMSPYLIDWFLARERLKALKVIIRAYRPAVPVDLLLKELAFGSLGDTIEFVDKFGLLYTDSSRTMIDCKSSTPILAAV